MIVEGHPSVILVHPHVKDHIIAVQDTILPQDEIITRGMYLIKNHASFKPSTLVELDGNSVYGYGSGPSHPETRGTEREKGLTRGPRMGPGAGARPRLGAGVPKVIR